MIDINIKHYPITKTNQVAELYSEKDGVDVKYVCTTELSDTIADIFYRDTPHPEFGNKYFANKILLPFFCSISFKFYQD